MSDIPAISRQDSVWLFIVVIFCYVVAAYTLSYVGAPVILTGGVVLTIIPVLIAMVPNRRKVVEWYKTEVDDPRMKYFGARNQTRGLVLGALIAGISLGLFLANGIQTAPLVDKYGGPAVLALWVALFLLTRQTGTTRPSA